MQSQSQRERVSRERAAPCRIKVSSVYVLVYYYIVQGSVYFFPKNKINHNIDPFDHQPQYGPRLCLFPCLVLEISMNML
jgi:hypothetical protein